MDPLLLKQFLCVFLGAVVAFVSTNVGGGALVMIPALLFLGLPPPVAVATMRFSGTGGMVTGLARFHAAGKVRYRLSFLTFFCVLPGTIAGALLLPRLDPHLLCRLIGFGNLLILALMLWRRQGLEERSPHRLRWLCLPLFVLAGLIGTLVGGLSIYVTFLMVTCFGRTFSEAAGTRKVVGFLSALVAITIFQQADLLNFSLGLPLFFGTLLGGHYGARYGLRRGDRWLGHAFTFMVIIASTRLLFR